MKLNIISGLITGIMLVSCGPPVVEGATAAAVAIPTYFALTEKAYAKEAEIQIKNLYQSASTYQLKNGSLPGDCYEEMEMSGDIEMKQSVIDAWDFQCDWIYDEAQKEITGTITATSTEANEAGAGKVVVYDIITGEATGYGQGNEE